MSDTSVGNANQNNANRQRSNQAADEFRTLVAILVGALLGIVISSGDSGINLGEKTLWLIGALGIASLFLLATSWSLQKSKSLARERFPNSAPLKQWFFSNWYYDQTAFALLLISANYLLFFRSDWGFVVSILVGALYLLTVFSLDRAVKDASEAKQPKRQQKK